MEDGSIESKFSNIYIMLLYSIMKGDLRKVNHFLSDELREKYQHIIDINNDNNEVQMYDELNVKDIQILSTDIVDEKENIKVKLTSRYMDYIIDKDTGNYKRGIDDRRLEKTNILTFQKSTLAKERPDLFKCPNCGAKLGKSNSTKCKHCRSVIVKKTSKWVLTSKEMLMQK